MSFGDVCSLRSYRIGLMVGLLVLFALAIALDEARAMIGDDVVEVDREKLVSDLEEAQEVSPDVILVIIEPNSPHYPEWGVLDSEDLSFEVYIEGLTSDGGNTVNLRYRWNDSDWWGAYPLFYRGNYIWSQDYPAWALEEYGGIEYYYEVNQPIGGGQLFRVTWPAPMQAFNIDVLNCSWDLYPYYNLVSWNQTVSDAETIGECMDVDSVSIFLNDGVSYGWMQHDMGSPFFNFDVERNIPVMVWKS